MKSKNWVICLDLVPFLDGNLSATDAQRFRDHLGVCQICESRLGDQMQMITQLASSGPGRRQTPAFVDHAIAYFTLLDRYRDAVAAGWPAEQLGQAAEDMNAAEVAVRQALVPEIRSVERMIAESGLDHEPPSDWQTKVWQAVEPKPPGRWRRAWNWLTGKE